MSSLMDAEDVLLRFEQWQNEVRREVERQGRYAQALNSILIVGAFIAGVQGQLLTEMLELDPTTLRARTCNLISFLGLVLEVTGTFFGAVNAVKLQFRAQRGTRALDCMEECKGSLNIVVKYIAKWRAQRNAEAQADSRKGMAEPSPPPTPNSFARPGEIATLISSVEDSVASPRRSREVSFFSGGNITITGGSFIMNHTNMDSRPVNAEVQLEICENIIEGMRRLAVVFGHETPRLLLAGIDTIIDQVHSIKDGEDNGTQLTDENNHEKLATGNQLKHVHLPAHKKCPSPLEKVSLEIVSLVAMGLGVLCLAVSIILFAGARRDVLGNEIWATCLAVLTAITLFSALPFIPARFVDMFMRHGRVKSQANGADAC
ncbi:hypothetical protein BKA70DRAFT_1571888 [Coprinopsis sp. MPI-PUGE-AT-0042]|nr:hypothetical protein BKA70DRAFT_1571888 [Coprinopsis sp. MPI-PUGE-AT-0042]